MTIPTLVGVAITVFLMLRVVPGDIVELKLRAEGAAVSEQILQNERRRLGLDKPLPQQFVDWVRGLPVLEFRKSQWTGDPVTEEIGVRIEVSLQIAILATILAVIISIPLGTLAAVFRDTPLDHAIRLFTVTGLAVPAFWMGMLIVLVLLTWFRWLPPIAFVPFSQDPIASLSQTIWPALAVGFRFSAMGSRMMRATLIEVLKEDYIRTARAKGLSPFVVTARHAMRNALLPVVTVFALEFAFLLGGLVVTEQIFNINGVGRLLVQSVLRADYTVVQALVMMIAFTFIIINLAIDLLYSWLDPRIRYSR
jgi:peptide/nickel transport system permease protein